MLYSDTTLNDFSLIICIIYDDCTTFARNKQIYAELGLLPTASFRI